MCMLSQCFLCVSLLHLGPVRSQLNEVTLTITRDVRVCVCVSLLRVSIYSMCVCARVYLSASVLLCVCVCVCVCVRLCDWQAQTVCDVLINHIDSLLLR